MAVFPLSVPEQSTSKRVSLTRGSNTPRPNPLDPRVAPAPQFRASGFGASCMMAVSDAWNDVPRPPGVDRGGVSCGPRRPASGPGNWRFGQYHATSVLLDELEADGFQTLFETNPLNSYASVSTTITATILAIQAHREL